MNATQMGNAALAPPGGLHGPGFTTHRCGRQIGTRYHDLTILISSISST